MRHLLLATWLLGAAAFADQTIQLDGEVPDDGLRYFELGFDVPAGTREIEVAHDDLAGSNILDWGLEDPNGYRGWGGGNEEHAIVGELASSRSYLKGPIPAGAWKVIVGKAKISSKPAKYAVKITLRTAPTLPPQPERQTYTPVAPLSTTARWYAGDFHVHSVESGDARPTLDEIATFVRTPDRNLDFVMLSDHNTISTPEFINDAQSRHPDVLLIPGMEYTTYRGHMNSIGSTVFADSRVGYQGHTLEQALATFHGNGALVSINHPVMDLPLEMCIGCAWEQPVPLDVDAVEIATTGWKAVGVVFSESAIAFWDSLSGRGLHVKALGGSDDHRAGIDTGDTGTPIGSPTTMVFATELSVAGIQQGIRNGRTVVKLQGPEDPMVDLQVLTPGWSGDTVIANDAHLQATVTGGDGQKIRFVKNGKPQPALLIHGDPYVAEMHAVAGDTADRWRAEVLVGDRPRTVTSNIWVQKTAGAAPSPDERPQAASDCGCSSGPTALLAAFGAAALANLARRRRPRSP